MEQTTTEAKAQTPEESEKERREKILAGVRLANRGVDLSEYSSASSGLYFVFRRCTRGEREVYRKLTRDDKRSDAQDSLMGCVLWPEKADLAKVLDDNPFVIEMLETAILNASGLHLDAVVKKA